MFEPSQQPVQRFLDLEGGYLLIRSMYAEVREEDELSTQKYFDALIESKDNFTVVLTDFLQIFNVELKKPGKSSEMLRIETFMTAVNWLKRNVQNILKLMDSGCTFEIVTLSQIMLDELKTTKVHELFFKDDSEASLNAIDMWAERVSAFLKTSTTDVSNKQFRELEERMDVFSSAEKLRADNEGREKVSRITRKRMQDCQKALAKYAIKPRNDLAILPDYVLREMVLDWWLGEQDNNFKGTLYSQGNLGIVGPLQFVRNNLLNGKLPHYILREGKFVQMSNDVQSKKPSRPISVKTQAVDADIDTAPKKAVEPEEAIVKELSPTGSADSSRSPSGVVEEVLTNTGKSETSLPPKKARLSKSLDLVDIVPAVSEQRDSRSKTSPPKLLKEERHMQDSSNKTSVTPVALEAPVVGALTTNQDADSRADEQHPPVVPPPNVQAVVLAKSTVPSQGEWAQSGRGIFAGKADGEKTTFGEAIGLAAAVAYNETQGNTDIMADVMRGMIRGLLSSSISLSPK